MNDHRSSSCCRSSDEQVTFEAFTRHKCCDRLAIYVTLLDTHNFGFCASDGKKLVLSPRANAIISGFDGVHMLRTDREQSDAPITRIRPRVV